MSPASEPVPDFMGNNQADAAPEKEPLEEGRELRNRLVQVRAAHHQVA